METSTETSTQSRGYYGPNIVLGLGILALGLALLLDRLHVLDAAAILQYWPLLVVLFGASIVWQALRGEPANGRRRMIISPGLVLFLVFIGLIANHADLDNPNRTLTTADEKIDVHAILGESRLTSTSTHFHGANMTSVLGSTVLDLRQATVAEGESAVIEVFGLMGSVDLLVPRDWVIESDIVPLLGEENDNRNGTELRHRWRGRWNRRESQSQAAVVAPPAIPAPAAALPGTAAATSAPRLIIRGSVMMGSLDIRS